MAENKNEFGENLLKLATVASIAVPSAGLASRAILFGAGRARNLFVSSMNNFLNGFYGKGVGGVGKAYLAGKEGAKGTARMAQQALSPAQSFAFNKTGVSKVSRDIYEQSKIVKKEAIDMFKRDEISYSKARSLIRNADKKVFAKLTNDYRNTYMYTGKTPYEGINRFINREGGTAKGILVNMKNKYNVLDDFDGQDLKMLGIGFQKTPTLYNQFAVYKNVPHSDVLRMIQFDRRVYEGLQALDRTLPQDRKANTIKAIFNKFNTSQVGDDIYISMSPKGKPNYDWGGYKGLMKYNLKKPDKIKLLASDRPDLFGYSAETKGRQTLNITKAREISIPKAKKDIEKIQDEIKDLEIESIKGIDSTDSYAEVMARKAQRKAIKNTGLATPTPKQLDPTKAEQVQALSNYSPLAKTDKVNINKLYKDHDNIVKNAKNQKGFNEYRNYFMRNRVQASAGMAGLAGSGLLGYTYLTNDE
tara:strand:+ start:388 stop:1809 length:1422 start_codon:yes stop_codon:yes gene_type:complete